MWPFKWYIAGTAGLWTARALHPTCNLKGKIYESICKFYLIQFIRQDTGYVFSPGEIVRFPIILM